MRRVRLLQVPLPTIRSIRDQYSATLGLPQTLGGPPEDQWNNEDVRGGLYGTQGRVCAYCQRTVSDSRGDVEHFRPKSEYRELMYETKNYFVSCRICNSNRKGKKFPLEPGAVAAAASDQQALLVERRLLLDPANDPVDVWVNVDFDDDLCEVALSAGAAGDRLAAERVPFTSEFFFLNVDNEITTDRFETINEAMEEALLARDAGDIRAEARVRRMASRYEPHGEAIRKMLTVRCPNILLPTPQEELDWYIGEIVKRIELANRSLERVLNSTQKRDVKRKRDENLWSLAVIWHDPPGGVTPDQVRDILETSGVFDAVQEKFEQL